MFMVDDDVLSGLDAIAEKAVFHFLITSFAPRVTKTLHERLLGMVMNASMSLFYTSGAGSIANRFGRDIELIDMVVPLLLIHTVITIFVIVARGVFIAVTGTCPFCSERDFLEQNDELVCVIQRPAYFLLGVQRWLGLVLHLVVCGIAIILAKIAVKAKGLDVRLIGLALVSVVGLSGELKWLIIHWARLEMSAEAVT
ncbi:hypothetical protein GGS23DRAFT_610335 [Durotheca rogersii]|uniref:uncharacterized protein n=1 Tax=Durotheca rogersii TaxID=419775 RepID=UPI0022210DE8|nr:uncharacterized protein GGS23DRAFT_610335 [Durotheca rogersii]KAI5862622.1 hypothetical protein GGS23DRAFT_610335 [Durotheca rogersii]